MDRRNLNCLTFNVRSLVDSSRRIDLLNTLFHNKIDVGFIQECHLRRNNKMKINGYNFIYDNSPLGVAIILKNNISYTRKNFSDVGFNCTFIQIESNTDNQLKKLLIGSIYISCNHPASSLLDGLNKILHVANDFDGFILGGDLNSRSLTWGDHTENANGKILENWLQDHSLEVTRLCDVKPSYPNGSSFLDHFLLSPHLINVMQPNFKISSLPTFSDHFPLKLELQMDFS